MGSIDFWAGIVARPPLWSHPKAHNIDLLLAMTQEAADKYAQDVKPGGILQQPSLVMIFQIQQNIAQVFQVTRPMKSAGCIMIILHR